MNVQMRAQHATVVYVIHSDTILLIQALQFQQNELILGIRMKMSFKCAQQSRLIVASLTNGQKPVEKCNLIE